MTLASTPRPLRRPAARALVAATGALLAATAAPARADNATCRELLEALVRQLQTPNHAYTTQRASFTGNTPRAGEIVTLDGMRWILAGRQWHAHPLDVKAEAATLRQRLEASMAAGRMRCEKAGTDTVDGDAAVVYTAHQVLDEDSGTSDTRTWVSRSRGLPVRQTVDLSEGKSHTDLRWDYGNVQAPAAR